MNFQQQASMLLYAEHLPALFNELAHNGRLAITSSGLVYLKVDDAFIDQGFNLLSDKQAVPPDYFNPYLGAHISVIYPEERRLSQLEQLGTHYSFTLQGLASLTIFPKRYYFLVVHAPELLRLRQLYGLTDKLLFKNHCIDLHITVGYTLLQDHTVKLEA